MIYLISEKVLAWSVVQLPSARCHISQF